MTKIILHDNFYPTGCKLEVADDDLNPDFMWWTIWIDGGIGGLVKSSRQTLLEFAYTIIDEFEEDDVEETPKSYVEVVE